MGKRSKRRKAKKNANKAAKNKDTLKEVRAPPIQAVAQTQQIAEIKPTSPIWKRGINLFFSTTVGRIIILIGLIGSIITILTSKDFFHRLFTSKNELDEEEIFVKGILLPDDIKHHMIIISIGSNSSDIPISSLKKGVAIHPDMIQCALSTSIRSVDITFKIIDNRIYLTDTIQDLVTGNPIAFIKDNKWKLSKGTYLNKYETDKSLEIKDKKGNIMFSAGFLDSDTLYVQGYFINDSLVTVVAKGVTIPCIPLDDKEINGFIRQITPLHDF